MAIFVLTCIDKPASLPLRMATREAHLAYMAGFAGQVRLAGPLLDAAGDPAGSLIFMEAADIAEVHGFSAADPYALAGLFERTEVRAFRPSVGTLG